VIQNISPIGGFRGFIVTAEECFLILKCKTPYNIRRFPASPGRDPWKKQFPEKSA
jgi:hypothetical protein